VALPVCLFCPSSYVWFFGYLFGVLEKAYSCIPRGCSVLLCLSNNMWSVCVCVCVCVGVWRSTERSNGVFTSRVPATNGPATLLSTHDVPVSSGQPQLLLHRWTNLCRPHCLSDSYRTPSVSLEKPRTHVEATLTQCIAICVWGDNPVKEKKH